MSEGSMTLHYTRWEVRRAGWWMLLFGLLCTFATAAAVANQWGDAVSFLPVLIVAVAFLAAADIVVGDSAIEPTQFHLGKPQNRGALLCSKFALLAFVFLLSPLLVQLLLQLTLGVSGNQVFAQLWRGFSIMIGWLLVGAAVGAASRSMRGVLIASLVAVAAIAVLGFFLAFGFDFGLEFSGAGGFSGGTSAPPNLITTIDLTSSVAALLLTVWLFIRARAVIAARLAIGLIVVVRLLLTALLTSSISIDAVAADPSDRLSIDSVSTTSGNRLRVAYRISGASDSTGIIAGMANALIEARSTTRTDTLYAVDVVRVNDSMPSADELASVSRYDRLGRLLFREMLAKSGVLILRRSDSLPIAGTSLHISVNASVFRLGPMSKVPLSLGTLQRDRTRHLELFSQPGTNQRPILSLRLTDRSPARAATLAEMANIGPLEYFEFSVEPNPMNCCNPIRRIVGSTESATFFLPGSQRTRTEADMGVPYEVAARGGTTLSWREWRFEHRERLEASAPVPRN